MSEPTLEQIAAMPTERKPLLSPILARELLALRQYVWELAGERLPESPACYLAGCKHVDTDCPLSDNYRDPALAVASRLVDPDDPQVRERIAEAIFEATTYDDEARRLNDFESGKVADAILDALKEAS